MLLSNKTCWKLWVLGWHQQVSKACRIYMILCFRLTACLPENVIFGNRNYLRIQVRFSERLLQQINRTGRGGSWREVKTSRGDVSSVLHFNPSLEMSLSFQKIDFYIKVKKRLCKRSIWLYSQVCINCFITIWQKHRFYATGKTKTSLLSSEVTPSQCYFFALATDQAVKNNWESHYSPNISALHRWGQMSVWGDSHWRGCRPPQKIITGFNSYNRAKPAQALVALMEGAKPHKRGIMGLKHDANSMGREYKLCHPSQLTPQIPGSPWNLSPLIQSHDNYNILGWGFSTLWPWKPERTPPSSPRQKMPFHHLLKELVNVWIFLNVPPPSKLM